MAMRRCSIAALRADKIDRECTLDSWPPSIVTGLEDRKTMLAPSFERFTRRRARWFVQEARRRAVWNLEFRWI